MSEICPKCGLPKELCVCESIAKEDQEIKVYLVKKKFGKKYTVIEGITDKSINLNDVAKKLKNKFACGGTAKENRVELQGDHRQAARDVLVEMGFSPGTIIVK